MRILAQTINAAETRRIAKELYLKRQRAQIIERLKHAPNAERKAVIRQIDGFLPVIEPSARIFWLKVRRDVERQIEQREVAR